MSIHPETPRPSLFIQAIMAGLLDLQRQLARLDWRHPLTRDDMRQQWPEMPLYLYIHLPAAKHFIAADAVTQTLLQAEIRAETGDRADDLPDERIVRRHGGPPAWGMDPLLGGASQESGSATDTTR